MDSTTLEKKRARLIEIIRELSYREGDFTLVSGKKSKYYVNLKPTMLHPEGAELIGELVVQYCLTHHLTFKAVGGLTLGADPLATSISLLARKAGKHWPAFIVRKEPKGHGTGQWIEGTENFAKGDCLLVIEDTTTTGGSSLKAVERVRECGYEVKDVLTLVDREEGGAEKLQSSGVKFHRLLSLKDLTH